MYISYPFSPADKSMFAESVDPDETVHNEPSYPDLIVCLSVLISDSDPFLEQWYWPDS